MVKSWSRLPDLQKRRLIFKAYHDNVFLITSPYFQNEYEEPTPLQIEVTRRLWHPVNTVRGVPNQHIREMVVMGGMRLSKTTTAGLQCYVAAYKAHRIAMKMDEWTPAKEYGQMKSQKLTISNVATNEDQSKKSVFAITKAMMEESPYFQEYCSSNRYKTSEINMDRERIDITPFAASSGGAAGKTALVFVMDEVDQFDDTEGPAGVDNVYKIMKNSTLTLYVASKGVFGKVFMISSSGLAGSKMWRLEETSKASGGEIIWMKVPTWYDAKTNPFGNKQYRFEDFETEFATEPADTWQLYGCDPSFASKTWIKNFDQTIGPCFIPDLPNYLNYIGEIVEKHGYAPKELDTLREFIKLESSSLYVAAGDPATRKDAFGIALGHTVGNGQIYHLKKYNQEGKLVGKEKKPQLLYPMQFDGFYRFVPKESDINVDQVEDFFLSLHYIFPLQRVMFDTLDYPHMQQDLAKEGLDVIQKQVRYPQFAMFKNYAQYRMMTMPPHPWLIRELKMLQERFTTTTRTVDHPNKGSKDIADAAILVLEGANLLKEKAEVGEGPALIRGFSVPQRSMRAKSIASISTVNANNLKQMIKPYVGTARRFNKRR